MSVINKALQKSGVAQFRQWRDHSSTLLVLALGICVTFVLYALSHRHENERLKNKSAVSAEVAATSLDLLVSNQTIRIQNYENDLQSFLGNVDDNSFYTAAILRNSLFDKIIRLQVKPSGRGTVEIKATDATDQDISPASSPSLQNIFKKVLKEQRKSLVFLFTHQDRAQFALAWQLPQKVNSYLLFMGDAEEIFASAQAMTEGMSLILEQETDRTQWLIEKKKTDKLEISQISGEAAANLKTSQSLMHHYRPRFSDGSYSLTFFFNKNSEDSDLSSMISLIAGLIITFLLAFVVHSLVRRNIEVRKLVNEKTAHLKVESEKAKEAAYVKTRFLANVSHEIRTPLNIIMGMTDLMRETPLSGKQSEYIQNMNSAGNHLIRLIDDILDMARVDTQDVKFKFENVDFLKFIEEIAHLVEPVCAKKGLKFFFRVDPQFPTQIYTDPSRLKQVLINLVNNAVKFTDQGQIELEAHYIKKGPITTQTARVEFVVRDSGVGIPKTKQNDIFKAFYQVNPSTTRNKSGVGLGLAIVRAIVSRFNGQITLKSEVGRGTEFRVELPLVIENLSPWIQRFTTEAGKNKKLLIVHADQNLYAEPIKQYAQAAQLQTVVKNWSEMRAADGLPDFNYVIFIPNSPSQKHEIDLAIRELQPGQKAAVMRSVTDLSFKGQTTTVAAPVLPSELFQSLGLVRTSAEAVLASIKPLDPKQVKSLVIVDDDPSNLLLLKAYLEGQTFKVRYANHGRNALELCEQETPDVLVADLQMPEMDGFTLVKELRRKKVEPMKVVILTADAQEETIQEATKLGIEAYLTKPIRKAEFLKALVEVFN